jgi:NADH-quinone oxidoreductase subunit F
MAEVDLAPLFPILDEHKLNGRSALLPVLHAVQEKYGYIPAAAATEVAKALNTPLSDVYGVIDFYAMFYRQPAAKVIMHVCADPVCAMAGAERMMKMMATRLEPVKPGAQEITAVTVERSPCLGLCEMAPALLVQGEAIDHADTQTWEELVAHKHKHSKSHIGRDISLLTGNCGKDRPTSLQEYIEHGGYVAFQKVLGMTSEAVINEVKDSGLVGRGGAAFPTGLKLESAAKADGRPKYVVCNADEAEPGTFKDRIMLEDDPQRVLEGILISAYAVGAVRGYIYIRGEYTYPYHVFSQAVADARQAGFLGQNILGSSFSFDLEIRRGAGAYICGEETALFESIEGKRGLPRVKPPFPTTSGLFGKPTAINNVETLANLPLILSRGAAFYRSIGTEKSPGPKLFCLSGDVERPGLYEVPFGVTFRHLLFDLAGGLRSGRSFKAALFGGAAGAFATTDQLDIRLSFEDLRTAGLPLGSGVITVFDETRDLPDILLRLAHFFAEESCGKCYPCQIGTQRQHEIMKRIAGHQALPGDTDRLKELIHAMTTASLCGLGQTAGSAVLSAIQHWPEFFTPSL